MDNINIRIAGQDDLSGLQSIFQEENQFHAHLEPDFIKYTEDVLRPEELSEIIENDQKSLFIAECDSQIVGATIISIKDNAGERWEHPYKAGFVEDIIVSSNFKQKGIGSLLINRSIEWLISKNIRSLDLQVWESNTNAIQFYQAIGFTTIRRKMRTTF